jgi:hypothetical protein
MTGLQRTAARVLMYKTERTSARPPQTDRFPLYWPLSRLSGATPTKWATSRRFSDPSSGNPASSVTDNTGPTPGGVELTRFRGYITLWGGGIHDATNTKTVS